MTWTDPKADDTLIEPVCQASAIRYGDPADKQVLFSNPASKKRENMTVRLSEDDAQTWAYGKSLFAGPSAYSDLVVLEDDTILCFYERGEKSPYETITISRFDLGWIKEK
jgi:sialidase-1